MQSASGSLGWCQPGQGICFLCSWQRQNCMISGKIWTPSFQGPARLRVISAEKGCSPWLMCSIFTKVLLKVLYKWAVCGFLKIRPTWLLECIGSSMITSRSFGQRSLVETERTQYGLLTIFLHYYLVNSLPSLIKCLQTN